MKDFLLIWRLGVIGKLKKNNRIIYYQGLRAGYPRHAMQTILTMSLWDVMKRQYESIKK